MLRQRHHPARALRFAAAVVITGLGLASASQAADRLGDASRLPPPASDTVDFARDIRPLLERSCLRCHGPEKPKSSFRLDRRESALKGGVDGVDIVPGQSDKSPLVHFVAGLVEDHQMPPKGKGDPLTSAEVAKLRAWIDQGAAWPEDGPRTLFSFSPTLRWITVDGDAKNFSEHTGLRPGFSGGIEHFDLREETGPDTTFTASGRLLTGADDYRVKLKLERRDLGYVAAGFEQWRSYDDDSGGVYSPFGKSPYDLNRDLHMDHGRAWFEVGLMRPDWPKVTLAYEYQYRRGELATLQWGAVYPVAGDPKNIYPGYETVDERVHVLRLDVSHEIGGFQLEENFRGEFYDLSTRHYTADTLQLGKPMPDKLVLTKEGSSYFQGVNTFTAQKQLKDWWLVAAGYLYSRMEGDASFNLNTVLTPSALLPPVTSPDGNHWFSDRLVLSQETHVANFNTMLGPWAGWTLSGGLQSEWMRQTGTGNANLDFDTDVTDPSSGLFPNPAQIATSQDRLTTSELIGLRFDRIPRTVLFADARLEQQRIGLHEEEIGGDDFLRRTDASSEAFDIKTGFTTSPWQPISFTAQVRTKDRQSDYNHEQDILAGGPGDGYSAFIRARDVRSEELKLRLSIRPQRWFQAALSYQLVSTTYRTSTDPVLDSPGGPLQSANHDAHIFSTSFTLTPHPRFYLNHTATLQLVTLNPFRNNDPSVVAWDGHVLVLQTGAGYVLNERTDLNATWTWSNSDFQQHNTADGLPLGAVFHEHALQFGVTHKFSDRLNASLQYLFFQYAEPTAGKANDFIAHGVSLTLNWRFL